MSANILATVYNKTLIAKAQNTTTDKIVLPKNYDEFIELAKKINALNDASTAGDPYYAVTGSRRDGEHFHGVHDLSRLCQSERRDGNPFGGFEREPHQYATLHGCGA